MKRDELEHVLRASAAITRDNSFVVIGSQAVLLQHPDAPAELLLSNEVDLYPAMHPERAELIDGAIEAATLEQRIRQLDPVRHPVDNISAWAARRAAEAAAT